MRERWLSERKEKKSDSRGGRVSAGRGHSIFHFMDQLEESLSQDQVTQSRGMLLRADDLPSEQVSNQMRINSDAAKLWELVQRIWLVSLGKEGDPQDITNQSSCSTETVWEDENARVKISVAIAIAILSKNNNNCWGLALFRAQC